MKKFLPIFFLLIAALIQAAGEIDENKVKEIADNLRCPICQGLSVKESSTGIAENMKSEIRSQLKAGKNEDEVYQFFVERYGEWILREPKKDGFNLLLWILPFVVVPGFIIFMFIRFRSWQVEKTEDKDLSKEEEEQFEKLFGPETR